MAETEDAGANTSSAPNYSSAKYWLDRTKETEAIFKKRWWKAAEEAWCEYEIGEDKDSEGSYEGTGEKVRYGRLFPIFWSSIKTLAPAYYSKTPIPVSQIRFGINDDTARTGARLLERLGVYSIETTPFDEVMRDVVMEFILSDCASTRVMLEAEPVQVPIEKGEDEKYYLENGKPYEGARIGEDAEGNTYGEEGYQNQKCYPMALSYDDQMWTHTASCGDEIEERWYRFCYPEHEAYEMFPEIEPEQLKGAMRTYGKEGSDKDGNTKKSEDKAYYLHGWEIWHKKTKKIYFISPDFKTKLLKEVEDTYHLRDFFPSPTPVIGTKQRKSLFPIPAFRYLRPLCDEMHNLVERIFSLADEARVRFVADGEYETEIREAVQSEEGLFIFISNLMSIVEKGGLANVIQALPVGDLQRSLQQLAALHEEFKQAFYEIYGIPDVVRGASDPIETAKAQEIKSFSASNRFRDQMNQIAALARDTLELLVDLKIGAYPPEKIIKITGAQYMDPDDLERFPAAYQMIQDDDERMLRLDLETDSTSYINEMIEQQNRNVAIQTVTQGLAAINGMPPMQQAIGFKTIQGALSGMRLGKDYMDDLDSLFETMQEQAKNPPPPQPDVEMLKVQVEQQKLQLKAQEMQVKSQEAASKIQSDQMKAGLEQQLAQFRLQLEAQKQSTELALSTREANRKDMEFQVEAQKLMNESQIEKAREQIDRAVAEFSMMVEAQRLEVDKQSAKIQGLESLMEEARLGKQQSIENLTSAIQLYQAKNSQQEQAPSAPSAPPIINIENVMPEPKRRKKRGSMVREDGSRVEFETEDMDED